MQNNKKFYLLLFVGIVFFTIGLSEQVFATKVEGHCYFNNTSCTIDPISYGGPGMDCDTLGYGNDLFNGRNCSGSSGSGSGYTYIADAVDGPGPDRLVEADRKAELIKRIDYTHNLDNGLSDNEKISANYIMDKMTGGHPDDWASLMNNPDISIGEGATVAADDKTTFFYYSGDGDILESKDAIGVIKPTINIYSIKTGVTVIYAKIEKGCGNLIANPIKLPEPINWSLEASVSVSVNNPEESLTNTTAVPGDIIYWRHRIKNSSSSDSKTNKDIAIYWKNVSGFNDNTATDVVGTLADNSGLDPGEDGDLYVSDLDGYELKDTDVGRTLCRTTTATPSSSASDDSVITASPAACVTVVEPGSSTELPEPPITSNDDACRPIIIAVNPIKYSDVNITAKYPDSSSLDGNNGIFPKSNNYSYYYYDKAIPVQVKIGNNIVGNNTYTAPDTIDVTSRYTDGNKYNAVIKETQTHITGATELTKKINVWGICTNADGISSSCITSSFRAHAGWTPVYSGKSSWSSQSWQCYDYSLDTGITSLEGAKLEAGANVNINPLIDNASWTSIHNNPFYLQYNTKTKSKASDWQVNRLLVGTNIDVRRIDNNPVYPESVLNPCDYYRSRANLLECKEVSHGTAVFNTNGNVGNVISGSNPLSGATYPIEETLPAGTKVCYVFSVRSPYSDPYNTTPSTTGDPWNHSPLSLTNNCIVIAKKPKVQIWGGDLSVGKVGVSPSAIVQTSASTKTIKGQKKTFGSWIEYGIFAPGTITGAASGSAFAGGMVYDGPTGSSHKCNYNTLSFTNTAASSSCMDSTEIGGYKVLTSIPDIEASFQGGGPINGSIAPSGIILNGIYNAGAGNITLTESTLQPGKSVIIKSTGTITIVGDQKYSSGLHNTISDLPQLVIIANNIVIDNTVKQVDAWLIASGSINTCSAAHNFTPTSTEMSINTCNNPLVVNGPIMANKLYLNRTGGSTVADPGGPAEIFNLRADAYLWAYNRASGNGHMQTVYSTELPVRL